MLLVQRHLSNLYVQGDERLSRQQCLGLLLVIVGFAVYDAMGKKNKNHGPGKSTLAAAFDLHSKSSDGSHSKRHCIVRRCLTLLLLVAVSSASIAFAGVYRLDTASAPRQQFGNVDDDNYATKLADAFISSSKAGMLIAEFLDHAKLSSAPKLKNMSRLDDDDVGDLQGPRTLVVLMGSLRGGEKAWHTLYSEVLDANPNTDLALLLGDTRPELLNATIFQRAKFYWKFPEFDDWGEPIDVMDQHLKNPNSGDWRETILPIIHENADIDGAMFGAVKAMHRERGSGAIIFVMRWFLQLVLDRLKLYNYYDRFVITRTDFYYRCRHSFEEVVASAGQTPQNYLYVPKGESYNGVTDRYLLVYRQQVMKALNIFPYFLTHFEDYPNRTLNPELTLKISWDLQGLTIKWFDRVFFTCGVAGDDTRWRGLSGLVPEGVRLKYKDEYRLSYATCNMSMEVELN